MYTGSLEGGKQSHSADCSKHQWLVGWRGSSSYFEWRRWRWSCSRGRSCDWSTGLNGDRNYGRSLAICRNLSGGRYGIFVSGGDGVIFSDGVDDRGSLLDGGVAHLGSAGSSDYFSRHILSSESGFVNGAWLLDDNE